MGVAVFFITPQFLENTQEQIVEEQKSQNEWIDIAIAYTASGEPENAIEAYRQAIAIQEVAVIPWINLAALLKEQDEYALARDAYKEFIRIFPLSSQGYSNLGELYVIWQEGSVEDAIEILELGIERTNDAALKRELERLQ